MPQLTESQINQIKSEFNIPRRNVDWYLSSAEQGAINTAFATDYTEAEIIEIDTLLELLASFDVTLNQLSATAGVLETTETKLDARRTYRLIQLRVRDNLMELADILGIEPHVRSSHPSGVIYSW